MPKKKQPWIGPRPNKHRAGKLFFEPTHEPTEAEIAAATAAIRETWTPKERERRVVGPGVVPVEYEPLRVNTRALLA